MHFNLVDLRLMVRIADTCSLTRAAEASHISLSAASTRIKGLEESLGADLLFRTSQGVTLTAAGQSLVEHARVVFARLEHMRADLREYTAGAKGHLRLFANTTALAGHLPPVVRRYLREHPDVDIDLQERLSHDIVRALSEGQADIGIVAGEVCTDALETHPYRRDRLVVLVPRGHELEHAGPVSFGETLAWGHVAMHDASAINSFLRQAGERMHRALKVRIQVDSIESACRMVDAGVGIAVLPESAARRHARDLAITIVPLSDAWATRSMQICIRSFAALPPFARDLLDLLSADASPDRPRAGSEVSVA
ncbi:LysR substrate-binding domain-containing protein [Ramlibacter sp.]|uniref:LysR substrate-binding domain-containing protein n=1 Tax=Ramlibacter sp. TaxID=1917967 RepID=UPI002D453081|nr:LysR substrate-binding domain-containing protein [Ramlibacter sp.]HYD77557.1 LysR substrate-binding domain-containing protein [Ramlibacter sp.]